MEGEAAGGAVKAQAIRPDHADAAGLCLGDDLRLQAFAFAIFYLAETRREKMDRLHAFFSRVLHELRCIAGRDGGDDEIDLIGNFFHALIDFHAHDLTAGRVHGVYLPLESELRQGLEKFQAGIELLGFLRHAGDGDCFGMK